MFTLSYLQHNACFTGRKLHTCVILVLIVALHVSPICSNDDSENVYVPNGENTELKCPFLSTSTPVIWQNTNGLLFDGREIDTNFKLLNKYKIAGNNSFGEFNLIIMNVSLADVGNFVCGTYFGNKTIQHSFSVQLSVPISNLTILKTDKGYLHGNTDNKLSIVCSISGGFPLRNISMRLEINAEIVMDEFERVLNFTIIPKENMHLANVTCIGYDDLLKTVLTETVTLNITYPPRVDLKAVPSAVISEGSLVALKCNHASNPESKIINWTKNKMPFKQTAPSSDIVFKRIHRDDAGSYECSVRNELAGSSASLQLIVLYAPHVSIVTLTNGSIFCNATGVPSVYKFSRWEHLSEFGEHIRYLVGSEDGILNVLTEAGSLTYNNSGKYTCTVENGIRGHSEKINQTGFIFLQFQGKPLCINDTSHSLERVDNKQKSFVTLSVIVVSFPAYYSIDWLHRDQLITQNIAKYSFVSMDTIVQTKIHGQLVHTNGYRFTVAFTAYDQEDYRNFSLMISNNNGTSICSVSEKLKRSEDGVITMCKETLFYGIVPLCFFALSGWIVFLIFYKKRHQITVGIAGGSERQQRQELQVVTNYYDEINDSAISNQSPLQNALTVSSINISAPSESSVSSTNVNDASREATDATYMNPYQQRIENDTNNINKYSSLTRSHHYFVVMDSPVSHFSNRKRHTY